MKLIFLSHRRLLTNFLALAIAIAALVWTTPASAQGGVICETGCVAWDVNNGCTLYMTCCVASPSDWACVEWGPVN